MQRLIFAAVALLLVQLGLIVLVNSGKNGLEPAPANTSFLDLAGKKVDSMELIDGDGKKLLITKKNDTWILPGMENAAADKGQINSLLEKLQGLKQGFVVATSAEAAKRFKVAKDSFERHVVLKAGENTAASFYVGTSPGFRQVHCRREGTDNIVALALSTYEFDVDGSKWLDKNVLHLDEKKISALHLPAVSLSLTDKKWRFDGGAGVSPDQEKVSDLLSRISGLAIEDLVDQAKGKALSAAGDAQSFSIVQDGKTLEYHFAKFDDNSYCLKRSGMELYYKVHKLVVDGITGFDTGKLTPKSEAPKEAAPAKDAAAPVEKPAAEADPAAPAPERPAPPAN